MCWQLWCVCRHVLAALVYRYEETCGQCQTEDTDHVMSLLSTVSRNSELTCQSARAARARAPHPYSELCLPLQLPLVIKLLLFYKAKRQQVCSRDTSRAPRKPPDLDTYLFLSMDFLIAQTPRRPRADSAERQLVHVLLSSSARRCTELVSFQLSAPPKISNSSTAKSPSHAPYGNSACAQYAAIVPPLTHNCALLSLPNTT